MGETRLTRRQFVGTAIAAGSLAVFGASEGAAANVDGSSRDRIADQETLETYAWLGSDESHRQMGFWVDTTKCEDCGTCAHACRRANDTPEDVACRRKILVKERTWHEDLYVSVSCMHCLNPSCMAVCPAKAISKREEDGAVVVDHDRCIGCKYCFEACPFSVPHYTANGMDKCDMCVGNGRYPGGLPACVERCPHDALHFGEIGELLQMAGEHAVQLTGITGPSLVISR